MDNMTCTHSRQWYLIHRYLLDNCKPLQRGIYDAVKVIDSCFLLIYDLFAYFQPSLDLGECRSPLKLTSSVQEFDLPESPATQSRDPDKKVKASSPAKQFAQPQHRPPASTLEKQLRSHLIIPSAVNMQIVLIHQATPPNGWLTCIYGSTKIVLHVYIYIYTRY